MSFEQYLQEAAGNLAGLPSKWIKALTSNLDSAAGQNSEIETTGVKVKSWSALTGAISKSLGGDSVGVAIFVDGIPTYLIMQSVMFSGSRPTYRAFTGDGSKLQQRTSRSVPDWDMRNRLRASGITRSSAMKLQYYDIPDHTKSDMVNKVAAGIRDALGIDWDEKSANTEFEIRKVKPDKKRLELRKDRRENRPVSRMSGSLAKTDTATAARGKIMAAKLAKSADMKRLVDIYNAFNKTSLTTDQFVKQAMAGKDFSVDEKIIREYTEAARNMNYIAKKIKTMVDPASWRAGDRDAFVKDMKDFGFYLPDLKEAFEGDEEMLALLEEMEQE